MRSARTSHKFILTALFMMLVSVSLSGQEEREYIRKGNKLYKKSEFAGSEGMYRRAQTQETQGGDAGFNLGDALYRQGRFGEAAGEFSKAAVSGKGDSLKQAEGFYNLGNSLVKEQKFEEGIESYINSLKLNPENVQAKYNLAWAQDQLRKQEEQDQDKDQNQEQQQQQQQQNENKEDKEDQQDKDDQKNQNQDDQQSQDPQDQQPSISREDAKRLLDAMAAREKETQEKVQRDKAAQAKVRVIKNW